MDRREYIDVVNKMDLSNKDRSVIIKLFDAIKSGEGATSNYNDLENKPSINGVTIEGNITSEQLGIPSDVANTLLKTQQTLTAEEQSQVQKNLGIQDGIKPKGGYYRSIAESMGAVYDEITNTYTVNGLSGITEQQINVMITIPFILGRDAGYSYAYVKNVPTLFLLPNVSYNLQPASGKGYDYSYCFSQSDYKVLVVNRHLSEASIYGIRPEIMDGMFANCKLLTEIKGIINMSVCTSANNPFERCKSLINTKIANLKISLLIGDSPLLSKESILYMIRNSAATSPITITLHPDAYSMAMADEDIQAALEEKTFVSLASA